MTNIDHSRFYRYEELLALLRGLAAEHPRFVAIETVGRSHEGREIPLVTLTDTATGPAADKPALWVDGNIHSVELSASAACLYFIDWLLRNREHNPDVARCLATRTFYVCPRINPDGAEWALADKPKWIRSSTRPYPFDEEDVEGLVVEDVDGDGRILQMRIPDPNGLWKAHPDEPRLMIRIKLHLTLRELHPQLRVLLKGQAIRGQMVRRERHRHAQILDQRRLILPGQGKHQI